MAWNMQKKKKKKKKKKSKKQKNPQKWSFQRWKFFVLKHKWLKIAWTAQKSCLWGEGGGAVIIHGQPDNWTDRLRRVRLSVALATKTHTHTHTHTHRTEPHTGKPDSIQFGVHLFNNWVNKLRLAQRPSHLRPGVLQGSGWGGSVNMWRHDAEARHEVDSQQDLCFPPLVLSLPLVFKQ